MIIMIMAVMIMMVISNEDADDDYDDDRAHIGRANPNQAKTRNRSRNIPSERALYDSIATVGEIRVWWRADFQSGTRVLKKVF